MLSNSDNLKYVQTLCPGKLADIAHSADIELTWSVFKSAVYELSPQETLGYVKRKHKYP